MAENGKKWQNMARNGRNGWKYEKFLDMARNCNNLLILQALFRKRGKWLEISRNGCFG